MNGVLCVLFIYWGFNNMKKRRNYRSHVHRHNNIRRLICRDADAKLDDMFSRVKDEYPELVQYCLKDLYRVKGYTETELAFGLSLPLHVIRKIARGDLEWLNRDVFLAILGFYSRVFCGFSQYSED